MTPLIINFCPTGMVPTKDVTPYVPTSSAEIVEQVHEAFEIGITIAHVHAREVDGSPTHRKDVYEEIVSGIRKHCPGLLVCTSLSGRKVSDPVLRAEVLALRPDMASLTLSSLNFVKQASVNAPDTIQTLAHLINEAGAHPELEVFDMGMINYGRYLIRKGLVKGPIYWNLLFGNIAGVQGDLSGMAAMSQQIEKDEFQVFAGLGSSQLGVISTAVAMGHGVRIGLEDNIWYDQGRQQLASNRDLLQRVHALARIHERPLMSAKSLGAKGFYNSASISKPKMCSTLNHSHIPSCE